MDAETVYFGVGFVCEALFLCPVYGRIVWIFLSSKKFRNVACYRIMIQIGLVQLSMAPGTFLMALAAVTGSDFLSLGNFFLKITVSSLRMEGVLGLVLALSRLDVLLTLCWSFYVAHLAVYFTPWTDYILAADSYLPRDDYSRPYTYLIGQIGDIIYGVCIAGSLLCYVVIIVYLIYTKIKTKSFKNLQREISLLVYAMSRFLCDATLTTVHCLRLVHSVRDERILYTVFIFNNLLFPPVLYLIMNSAVRREFFYCKKKNTVVQVAVNK
ncbi:hypothetical protein L596_026790 [Steinernema carpocapsae]|uniref:G-protein coupled receptors family 1 profile domain-containing protein n=1 Tax=Steinernema carpocapsae TaxID=34508 RepID=A0A4U5M2D7_STECR|nr:hypothetical protein L596_026790 [Steinernema carpocapsae]